MKTTIDRNHVIQDLKKLGVTDEKQIEFILQSLPSENDPSEPQEPDEMEVQFAPKARVEMGQGNPSNPIAVYIKNLTALTIGVEYTRTVDGESTYFFNITIQPNERYFVGYHCETMTYSTLCSRNITTRITNAA